MAYAAVAERRSFLAGANFVGSPFAFRKSNSQFPSLRSKHIPFGRAEFASMERRGITGADQVEIHVFIQQGHIFYSPSRSFSLTGPRACLCLGTGLQSRLNC